VATSIILAAASRWLKCSKSSVPPAGRSLSRLSISQATARRDLRVLVREKKITRTYGGALGAFDATFAPSPIAALSITR